LPVSAPFHCSLMRPAQERLTPELQAIPFQNPAVPVVNNVRAELIRSGTEARRGLIDQIPSPVLWEPSIRRLLAAGVNHYLEVGPGRVLTGMMRQIDRTAAATNVEDSQSLEKTLAALRAAQTVEEKAN